jgi:hypothetical protein
MLSLADMVAPAAEKWTALMSNCDLRSRSGLFDTRNAMQEHLPRLRKGVTSMGDATTNSSIYE